MASNKKASIREFVSEDGLKFQLYLLKYSNLLKNLETKSIQEIQVKWDYDINKRISRLNKDATKAQFQNKIAQDAILFNKQYILGLKAPIDKDEIIEGFNKKKQEYIESLEKRISDNNTATLDADRELLAYAKEIELTSEVSKEKFGQMLLLIIKNLATMPSFGGYSDNWKTDFFSNAIEKTLLYLDNFDECLISKRTGNKSKAFAYITQICFNAFINVINIRKKENAFLKNTISLESANLDGVKHFMKEKQSQFNPYDEIKSYIITINSSKDLKEAVKKGLKYINESNEIYINNKNLEDEIKYLEKVTPEEDKNQDYYTYIEEINDKKQTVLQNKILDSLIIEKPSSVVLDNADLEGFNFNDINLIITEEPKIIEISKVPEKEEIVYNEIAEFDKEW